ncbi:hypothetical protein V1478_014578 [Vespula squamosa]|uniref:Ig-like domain-containing protein n=1 Tax=Vespula squamosa TaxID=30214 RepID=A0ABD2A9B7_VESSQ
MDWLRKLGPILLLLLFALGTEEVEALRMLELVIPQYVVRGQNIRLECSFSLDGEILYSVKWYKDGNEFYRYVPRDMPPVLVFPLPGVTVDIHNSTERSVVLYSVNLMSSGRYRCEVSAEAPSFQTVSDHSDMMVVALPENGPVIAGRPGRHRYQVSDVVRFNCTSAKSKPAAMLSWFINGEPVDPQYLRGPHITEVDREGLETAVLGLEFRLRTKHFKKGDMKIKCLATIATVYWKSNELSIEGERPLKIPVMESRETRAQGHTHAEHILGMADNEWYYQIRRIIPVAANPRIAYTPVRAKDIVTHFRFSSFVTRDTASV